MLNSNPLVMPRNRKTLLKTALALGLVLGLLGTAVWAARTSLKLRFAAWQMARESVAAEPRHRLEPRLKALPSGWIGQMCQPMDRIWAPLGLKGMNYFSFGGPPHWFARYSARSEPSSRFYQAWFGVYVIAGRAKWFAADGSIDASQLARVAECDQNAWLSAMGDEAPQTRCETAGKPESLEIAGKSRPLIRAALRSHSDLNPGGTALAALLGMPRPDQWSRELEAYHDILLAGYFSTWHEPVEDVTIVVYANAAGYQTKDGRAVDFFPSLQKELLSMMKSVEFERPR